MYTELPPASLSASVAPSFGTMLSPDAGMDLLIWLALGVIYGLSVWFLIRQELHGTPLTLGKACIVLPFPHRSGSIATATETSLQEPDTPQRRTMGSSES